MEEHILDGKVAFVTGASEGMGKATSFHLSSLGADVVLVARRLQALEEMAAEVRKKFGTDPLPVRADVSSDGDVEAAVSEAMGNYGRLDFVANFAGSTAGYVTGERKRPIHELTVAHMKEIAEVDHFGSVRVLKYTLPFMIRQRSGTVVLVSSSAAVYGFSENVDYIPYKAANEGLARSTGLRSERDGWGVGVYTIAPGDTFNPSTWDSYSDEERRESLDYGLISSDAIARVTSWIFSGRLKERFEMKVNVDTGEVLDEGRYVPLSNGDVIVVDAKTAPRLYESVGEPYKPFVPH